MVLFQIRKRFFGETSFIGGLADLESSVLSDELVAEAQDLLDLSDSHINESLEKLREEKKIGQSLDAELELRFPSNTSIGNLLEKRAEDLAELFIVSKVTLIKDDSLTELEVHAKHASGVRCPRSWRWVPELISVEPGGMSHAVQKYFQSKTLIVPHKFFYYDKEKDNHCKE